MQPRLTPARPWEPLSDAEWAALAPFLPLAGPGRPIADARGRLDAIFRAATLPGPWTGPCGSLPAEHGPADTVSRCFRRWAHAGLWGRLLYAVAHRAAPPALRALEHWICRAYRRALRLLGLRGIVLARRLGLLSALPAPPHLLPDPDLSEAVHRVILKFLECPESRPPLALVSLCRRLLRLAGGRARLPRHLAPA